MNIHWIFLSHQLNKNHFAYGNGDRIYISQENSIIDGNSSNNSHLSFPAHFGTHIDYPFHFDNYGKTGSDYSPDYFISNKVQYIELNINPINDNLIGIEEIENHKFDINNEILIINTGIGKHLNTDEYWNSNPGFHPALAAYFKQKMPRLRIFGFDSISLTGRKYRAEGKEAHKEFLLGNNILILEDMYLEPLSKITKIEKIIISPLRFENADGAPVTIFAKVLY